MEILLAAGLMSIAREGDDSRFDGTTMRSALPGARVIPERRRPSQRRSFLSSSLGRLISVMAPRHPRPLPHGSKGRPRPTG
jgi:hypothetical protein